MVAGACLAAIGAGLSWQMGAQARDTIAAAASAPTVAADRASPPKDSPPAPAMFVAQRPSVSASAPTARASADAAATGAPAASAASRAVAASGAIDDTPPDRYLLLRTVSLRSGRRGEAYRPLQLVRQFAHTDPVSIDGQLPPGLVLGDDGNLRGVPTLVGLYQFHLEVVDSASSQRLARQAYALRILPPARAAVPASPASIVAPSLTRLTESESAAYADVNKAVPASYELTSIAQWVPTEEAARPGTDAASAVVVAPPDTDAAADANAPITAVEAALLPTIDQLRAILTPLLGIEYPTRPLFVQALQTSRCNYYRAHLLELAKGKTVDTTCPARAPPTAAASAARKPGDPMTLAQFYQDLLPARIEKEVIDAALAPHPFADAKPLTLTGDGCGCHIPKKDENVYGLFPYWLATKAVQTVDFSLFSHIGFMGAVLQDDGSLSMPSGSLGGADSFARTAAQHETSVDLVVYRRDWAALLRLPENQLDAFALKAAHEAVQETELRFDDATARWLQPLLLPGWRAEGRVYAGLTIFFDDTSVEPEERAAFKRFYMEFAEEAIGAMQRHGHSYHLNFVVPDDQLGDEEGAYGFTQLSEYMELAQPAPRDANADEATKRRYKGKTDISVFYLVTLGAPSSESRLELRTRVDRTTALDGHRRVAFLQGIVPMVFGTRMADAQPMPPVRAAAIGDDLAYMRWNYGGAGFWPAPIVVTGAADPLHDMLVSNYRPPPSLSGRVCELACPNRLLLRLFFQLALLVDLAALVAYAWSCRLRRAGGRQLLMLIWLGGLATVAIGAVVFKCDPLLDSLRTGNVPFWIVIGLVILWGAYKTFRPRTDPP